MQQTASRSPLPAGLALGPVSLSVADLERSLAYYTGAVGLRPLERDGRIARLGVADRTLLVLHEVPGARPAPRSTTGLYHLALLVPERADLARFVRHYAATERRLGQADHLVSEAVYLYDPDAHGIEVYRDRPRDEWVWDAGEVRMASDPLDMESLMGEPGARDPWTGLPDGTVMGHVHLRVADLDASRAFYVDVLGFDVATGSYPGALFVSAGGYHHHLGLNVWSSLGGSPEPAGSARLERVSIVLPGQDDLDAVADRLHSAGWALERREAGLNLSDPAGNPLRFLAA